MPNKPLYKRPTDRLPNVGVFLSGSGSNAETLLNTVKAQNKPAINVSALITDAPLTSRARELGSMFDIPVVELDIREFYLARGETRVSIATQRGQEVREEWTNELRKLVAPLNLDFGVFAGFVPLTNITADLPCLNVHPGDLTYMKDGKRLLVGLHTIPIELAMLEGLDYLRSSVILVEPYSGGGDGMDSGHLLGVSQKVPIDFMGEKLDDLKACVPLRPAKRPKGGFADRLEKLAQANQDNLKHHGDWVVLPQAVMAFAAGLYAQDENGTLLYGENGDFTPVNTIEFSADLSHRPIY